MIDHVKNVFVTSCVLPRLSEQRAKPGHQEDSIQEERAATQKWNELLDWIAVHCAKQIRVLHAPASFTSGSWSATCDGEAIESNPSARDYAKKTEAL